MTLRLTDDETDALRRRAELESRSMQDVARQAVRDYVEQHSRKELLDLVLDSELPRYAEALDRLGEVIYLTVDELLYLARRAIGADPDVRDYGLLESALARPSASAFGADAYETLDEKAAALVHSTVRNHALVDGNKRLGLAALIAFLGLNGRRLTFSNDEAYEFITAIAEGELDDVPEIARRISAASAPR